MPSANTFRAIDPSGTRQVVPVTAAAQTIIATSPKIDLAPTAGSLSVATINTAMTGVIRVTNINSDSVSLVDNTGNLDVGGSNLALAQNEYVELERATASDRWSLRLNVQPA